MGSVVPPTLAVALLLEAAVVREPAVPRAEELVGLAQTGGGLALHPNSRNPRPSNHGARPCSHKRRTRRFRPRAGDHAGMPTKQPKGMDI